MCLMLSGFACVYVLLYLLSFIASNNLDCYRHCGCSARACVCVSVRSFLPLRASISRNIGMYVFTATRKTLYIGIIIVIFAENASFRSYGRRHLLAPNATNRSWAIYKKRIPTESTQTAPSSCAYPQYKYVYVHNQCSWTWKRCVKFNINFPIVLLCSLALALALYCVWFVKGT